MIAQSARRVMRLGTLLLALTAAALLFSPTFRVRIAAPDVAEVNASVQAPNKPCDYLLVWDMVVEHSGRCARAASRACAEM